MENKYLFRFEEISVYACAVDLISQASPQGGLHIDLGSGNAPIAEQLIGMGFRYVAFDHDKSTVQRLCERGIEAYQIDLLDTESTLNLICAICDNENCVSISMLDVIEHLDYECLILREIRERLHFVNNLILVVSVPNSSHIDVSLKLFGGVWDYTSTGLLDSTHKVIYTDFNLNRVMRNSGWAEIGRKDYRLEYSDQFAYSPRVLLNRNAGVGGFLRKLKSLVDPFSDVHQLVRSYAPSDSQIVNGSENGLDDDVLLSIIFYGCVECERFRHFIKEFPLQKKTTVEFFVPESIVFDCSNFDFIHRYDCDIDELFIQRKVRGRYAMLVSETDFLRPEVIDEVCDRLFIKGGLSLVYFKGGVELTSNDVVMRLVDEINHLPQRPCPSLFFPVDYFCQFSDFPKINFTDFDWARLVCRAAFRLGLQVEHVDLNNIVLPPRYLKDVLGSGIIFETMCETFSSNNDQILKRLNEDELVVQALRAELVEVQNQLSVMMHSRSWALTASLRKFNWFANKIVELVRLGLLRRSTWKRLARAIYVRSRVLQKTRQLYLYVRGVVASILTMLPASRFNLHAIQALSSRRFGYPYGVKDIEFDSWPELDVSVVSYNSEKWIERFFSSLITQKYPTNKINLRFVDNGSDDRTCDLIREKILAFANRFSSIELLVQSNLGFGAGHDLAIRSGASEYCLVTNLDLEFEADSLCNALNATLADDSTSVASWELRQVPYEHPKYYDPVTLETNWSSHACILIRRSAYLAVGGYDHKIFMYSEDVELSYRLRSYGYRLKYLPAAVVNHFTYENAGQIKPLQFTGSTIGNLYIRLRYGSFRDRIGGVLIYAARFVLPSPFKGAKKLLGKNALKALGNIAHFVQGKGDAHAYFPFRGFDYEMVREGAFWECSPIPLVPSTPLVTVITRTYHGRGMFLRQAIRSVFNQTYPRIELIVVEDGGGSHEEFVESFSKFAPPAVTVRFLAQEKVGRSATGNAALAASKGHFVMFLDDDDLLFSDHVETLVGVMLRDERLSAAYSLAFEVHTKLSEDRESYTEELFTTPNLFHQEWNYDVLLDHNFIPIQSILFRRTLYEQRGGFDIELDQLEDWNLWLRYGYGNQFSYVPKTTSLFRSPSDYLVRSERHALLHDAYLEAKKRALFSLERLGLM